MPHFEGKNDEKPPFPPRVRQKRKIFMRYDKLTTKFQSALQTAQSQALAADNAYLEATHVLKALLDDTESGMGALLVNAGGNLSSIKQGVQAALNSLPKVSGQGGEMSLT